MRDSFPYKQTPVHVALLAMAMSACTPDFAALQGTAVNEDTTPPDDGPIAKAMVVGDPHSPKLANFFESRNIEVVDVPYARFVASEIEIDGDYIVWSDNRNGALDIYGYQISTGTEFPISTAAGDQKLPQISGDYVVWEDHRDGNADIYAYQISTKKELKVSIEVQNQLFPQIDGDYIVWHDLRRTEADIYAYRISTGETLEVSTTQGDGDQWYPKVSGDYIVWQSYSNGFSDIHGYHIPTQQPFDVTTENDSSQFNPEIDGDYVVWVDNRNNHDQIFGYQISTRQEIVIANAAAQHWNARVSGDYVVWQVFNSTHFDIQGYRLSSGASFSPHASGEPGDQILPEVSGDYIVWQDSRHDTGSSGNFDIYAYSIGSGTSARLTTNETPQTNVDVDGANIAWLDHQRGIVDVYHSVGGAEASIATNTWLTPAGVAAKVTDQDVIVFGSDFVSDAVVLELFDTAVSEGKGILGLGGTGASLARALHNDGNRYGVSVAAASGCGPMEAVIGTNSAHPLFSRVAIIPTAEFEFDTAETMDELAITMDTSAVDTPVDIDVWGHLSNFMCLAAEPTLVEFPLGSNGTRVILDGTANIADAYLHWTEDRWEVLFNEITYLKPDEDE